MDGNRFKETKKQPKKKHKFNDLIDLKRQYLHPQACTPASQGAN